jgi:hypothetical protein
MLRAWRPIIEIARLLEQRLAGISAERLKIVHRATRRNCQSNGLEMCTPITIYGKHCTSRSGHSRDQFFQPVLTGPIKVAENLLGHGAELWAKVGDGIRG